MPVARRPAARHLAALLGANVVLTLGPWSTRLADCGPVSAGFWRVTLALPALLAIAIAARQNPFALPGRMLALLLIGGVMFAIDLVFWQLGIPRTRLANATLFGNCSSVILVGWALIAARRWPRRGEAVAIGAMAAGAAILLSRSAELSGATLAGDIFCVLAGMFYVGYLVALRHARGADKGGAGSWAAVGIASLVAAPVLLGAAIAFGEPIWPGPTHLADGWWAALHGGWVPLILLSFGSQVIGQGLLVYALRHFTPLVIGLALMVQPAVAVVLGWVAFGEALGWLDGLGVVLVSSALVMARVEDD